MQRGDTGSADGGWRWLALTLFGVAWGANQFAPMLLVYGEVHGLSPTVLSGTFGVYAVGLAPGIVLGGPLSDRVGRRVVVVPAAVLSLVATAALLAAPAWMPGALFVGRLLAGLASGFAFSAGSTWLLELSADAPPGVAGVRNTVALTAGFGTGPLVSGALAELAPAPEAVPYLPHLALLAFALVRLPRVRVDPPRAPDRRLAVGALLRPAIPLGVAAVAPFSFGGAVATFAALPQLGADLGPAMAGVLTAVTLGTSVAVQPVARRLGAARPARLGVLGLAFASAGYLAAIPYAATPGLALLFAVGVLQGVAYGLVLLYVFLSLGRAPSGVAVAQAYVAAYVGFAYPSLVVGVARALSPTHVFVGLAAVSGALMIATAARGDGGPAAARP